MGDAFVSCVGLALVTGQIVVEIAMIDVTVVGFIVSGHGTEVSVQVEIVM